VEKNEENTTEGRGLKREISLLRGRDKMARSEEQKRGGNLWRSPKAKEDAQTNNLRRNMQTSEKMKAIAARWSIMGYPKRGNKSRDLIRKEKRILV